jgi:hypothetical protein
MASTEEALIKQYGILISMKDCAELLGRSTEGLRVTLCRDNPLSQKINSARVKFGRRVMFKSSTIAQIIDEA